MEKSSWAVFKNSLQYPNSVYLEGQKRPSGVYTEIPEAFNGKSVFINMNSNGSRARGSRSPWINIQADLRKADDSVLNAVERDLIEKKRQEQYMLQKAQEAGFPIQYETFDNENIIAMPPIGVE